MMISMMIVEQDDIYTAVKKKFGISHNIYLTIYLKKIDMHHSEVKIGKHQVPTY